jgi:membrane fusion protein, multidrug efflux system
MSGKRNGFLGWIKGHLAPGAVIVAAVAGVMAISAIKVPNEEFAAAPVPPVNVEVLQVEPITSAKPAGQAKQLCDCFELLGKVRPNRAVDVAAEVAATVEALPREKGQHVRAGELLVVLNTDLLKAELDRVAAQVKFNQAEHDRISALRAKGAAAVHEVDIADTTLDVSKAELAAVEARMKRTKIYAPFGGSLNERPVELGAYVAPGMRVATIVDLSVAKVTVDVPERDVHFLHVGQDEEVAADTGGISGGGQQVLKGKVSYINDVAEEQTHTTQIEIAVSNESGALRSGQMVRVRLARQTLCELITVPLGSIIPLENGKAVYVVDAYDAQARTGVARQRAVTLGFIRGTDVQILAGLRGGDRLILPGGNRYVSDGQKVLVIPQTADSASRPTTQTAGK